MLQVCFAVDRRLLSPLIEADVLVFNLSGKNYRLRWATTGLGHQVEGIRMILFGLKILRKDVERGFEHLYVQIQRL